MATRTAKQTTFDGPSCNGPIANGSVKPCFQTFFGLTFSLVVNQGNEKVEFLIFGREWPQSVIGKAGVISRDEKSPG